MFKIAIILILITHSEAFVGFGHEGVLGKIKSGFEMARKLLGLDKAAGVAQLVADAFSSGRSRKGDSGNYTNNIFSGFLRVLGLDTKRIGAMAVNAIIFVAQLISTSLSKGQPHLTQARALNDGSPLEWLLQNKNIQDIIKHAKDANLPHEIIEHLKEDPTDQTGCIQLLICKASPFVWGMQKAINAEGKDIKMGKSALTGYIPTMDQVADNADECETKFPHCLIHY